MAARSVSVIAPARLHLGFLDLHGGLGRRFGSIGLAISSPRTRLTIGAATQAEIIGPECERVQSHLKVMQQALGLGGALRIRVEEAIPAHAGLGSGTQLALAVGAGIRRLHDLPLDAAGDAVRLGRGARSGVGADLFMHGGVVVDAGHGSMTKIAPIVSRIPFPEYWRVLIVLDPARQGLHGRDEGEAFATLPPFPEVSAARLCRLVLMQALPALAERDLASFGTAIKHMQDVLGDYFAPMQGESRFTSPAVGDCLHTIERAGAHGVGQSSWGPTGFAFAASPEEAGRLARLARDHAKALDIRVCTGLNRGADIQALKAAAAGR
jgi:beta-RFAP synthase